MFPSKSFDYTRLRLSLRVLEFCGVRGYFGAKNHRQKKAFLQTKRAYQFTTTLKSTKTTNAI
ncbi:hypothetical protein JP0096_14190 [Helicobacter pylori]|nr:hypothetical protein JP0059_14800 [Helicobacter pylori]GHR36793.1 hypothetical protein JP0096_14190 [Helicobacter pylori]